MTGNRSKLKFAAAVGLVFFVGVLAGVLGASIYFETRIEKMFHGGPPKGERVLERLSEELDLTPTQLEEIRPIIMGFDKKTFDLRRQFFPQMKRHLDQVKARIRTKLNDKQKRKFDEFNKRMEKRFRGRLPFPPPIEGPRENPFFLLKSENRPLNDRGHIGALQPFPLFPGSLCVFF